MPDLREGPGDRRIESNRQYGQHLGELPWRHPDLNDWSIVGMNHYRQSDTRRLFVSMEKDGRCIKVEGLDTPMLWEELRAKACIN